MRRIARECVCVKYMNLLSQDLLSSVTTHIYFLRTVCIVYGPSGYYSMLETNNNYLNKNVLCYYNVFARIHGNLWCRAEFGQF